jgi:hypothetical protein
MRRVVYWGLKLIDLVPEGEETLHTADLEYLCGCGAEVQEDRAGWWMLTHRRMTA